MNYCQLQFNSTFNFNDENLQAYSLDKCVREI